MKKLFKKLNQKTYFEKEESAESNKNLELLTKKDFELIEKNNEPDQKNEELDNLKRLLLKTSIDLKTTEKRLEEANMALERTNELKNFTEILENKIKERTFEFEKKATELGESKIALLNILEDVEEEREKAEEEKNKTLAIITHLIDGLLVFDSQNNLLLINPSAESLSHVKSIEIVNKPLDELALSFVFFESLFKILDKEIKEVFRKEITFKDFVFEISSARIVFDKNKSGSLVIIHDVTREKAIEKIKSDFITIAAHQLRTPLSAIKWVIKMVLDGDVGELTTEQYTLLNKGYLSNERAIRLVNDLLDVSRIEEGKFGFNFEKIDFQKIIDTAIINVEGLIIKNHQELIIEKPEKLPRVYLDKERMVMVLQNLLSNAIKYTQEYGKIKITVKFDKQFLYVKINDNGVGILKKDQPKVFSKFFRGANVIKLETDGSGLGLFIVKNIIEKHNGKVSLTSEEGKGTEVNFSIPINKIDNL